MVGKSYRSKSPLGLPAAFWGRDSRFKTKGDAEKAKQKAIAISREAKTLRKILASLDQDQRYLIFESAYQTLLEQFEGNIEPNSPSLHDLLFSIEDGAKTDSIAIKKELETIWTDGKRTPKRWEHQIARELAMIYTEELGKYPVPKKSDRSPSDPFSIAVAEVFEILGISMTFESPSKEAAKWICENHELEDIKRRAALRSKIQQLIARQISLEN